MNPIKYWKFKPLFLSTLLFYVSLQLNAQESLQNFLHRITIPGQFSADVKYAHFTNDELVESAVGTTGRMNGLQWFTLAHLESIIEGQLIVQINHEERYLVITNGKRKVKNKVTLTADVREALKEMQEEPLIVSQSPYSINGMEYIVHTGNLSRPTITLSLNAQSHLIAYTLYAYYPATEYESEQVDRTEFVLNYSGFVKTHAPITDYVKKTKSGFEPVGKYKEYTFQQNE